MIPSKQQIQALHRKYAPNDVVYDLVFDHCQVVAEIGLWCADNLTDSTAIDTELYEAAALLHDIGTYVFFNDEGKVANERLYVQHAMLGAKIVADEGLDPRIAAMIQTHVLMGLSKQEIIDRPWPLPMRDYLPQTVEAELLCYADRFHSKRPVFNSYDTFLTRLEASFPQQAPKFKLAAKRYGIPNIQLLASKYGHPVD